MDDYVRMMTIKIIIAIMMRRMILVWIWMSMRMRRMKIMPTVPPTRPCLSNVIRLFSSSGETITSFYFIFT